MGKGTGSQTCQPEFNSYKFFSDICVNGYAHESMLEHVLICVHMYTYTQTTKINK